MRFRSHDRVTALSFNAQERNVAIAIFERMFPKDERSPGATEIGLIDYIDGALSDAYQELFDVYREGLAAVDCAAVKRFGTGFADCSMAGQDAILDCLEGGRIDGVREERPGAFFELLRRHLQEGLFCDPIYRGNRDKLGWRFLGHPGVWFENSADENLCDAPVDKGGVIQSLEDVGLGTLERGSLGPRSLIEFSPHFDEPDIIIVGLGGVGGVIASLLTSAGLTVTAFEAGPWREPTDFLPDELGETYYCRSNLGPKFSREIPRWRRNEGEVTQQATFSMGRMVNGVGGSIVHYGSWLRRFHPHHFHLRSHFQAKSTAAALPANSSVSDWPITYEQLEAYYSIIEHMVGVAGDDCNPFIQRSRPLPLPPTRPFRMGELFKKATFEMGLHPHAVPAGIATREYQGRPATRYSAWFAGFGSRTGERWDPSQFCVPEALATGNLELNLNTRVTRIVTDRNGHVAGVQYLGPDGVSRVKASRQVILCAYTFENLRLMFASGTSNHPNGLGNNRGQLGKNFMTKMFAHVNGFFPDVVFNRHTGPAFQAVVLDDFLSAEFDSFRFGFLGGATLGAEQQFLPIQISREALPPTVRSWGEDYKRHIEKWQHFGVIRIQPDTLPYTTNFIDLDPSHKEDTALRLPVLRITYDMRENEHKLAAWMESMSEEILRAMGAKETWRGERFTGVGSCHDLGGARMGEDPLTSVVGPELEVHDTPGLYVYSGAAFPTCPGINPTLTLWAVCYRAAERLIMRAKRGEI